MIQVQGLTKTYRGRAVVDGISFEAARGEIVGFLGPNGAGKSTTMRMLAGFLLPDAGTAKLAGHDVVEESLEARRCLGYMPEDVPLYPEMRVEEYLHYRAGIKGVAAAVLRSRVDANMERCGVADVRRKLIGTLSKGYRQRIGLADALVHDPDILILDEPTNGLDPNQIRSVREIIRSLAGRIPCSSLPTSSRRWKPSANGSSFWTRAGSRPPESLPNWRDASNAGVESPWNCVSPRDPVRRRRNRKGWPKPSAPYPA
jgi:ABC-2 type transport system ATP-binding protein